MDKIVNNLEYFCRANISNLNFAILFGSVVTNQKHARSDIDCKIFLKSKAPLHLRRLTGQFIAEMNQEYCGINYIHPTDVPYEIKTVIDSSTLKDALALKVFKLCPNKMIIPEIYTNTHFLNSEQCQMRTVLSALTTPNILITGDKNAFNESTRKAFCSIKTLISSVYGVDRNNIDQIVNLLIKAPDGRTYKDYLGYRDSMQIRNHFYQNLKEEHYG